MRLCFGRIRLLGIFQRHMGLDRRMFRAEWRHGKRIGFELGSVEQIRSVCPALGGTGKYMPTVHRIGLEMRICTSVLIHIACNA